ncbi:MAG: PaaI family thioesterase [Flavobacteriia bacterium]|jgi:acyl-CoA thioesterase|nr:PaaI family thioesterase [Flavobacteriia bacterium]
MKTPQDIVSLMLQEDAYSRWLGLHLLEISAGRCLLECRMESEMLNGFQRVHGGITYALSDSAMAFAANAHGYKCYSIETSISHTARVELGDVLKVQCQEIHRGKTLALYEVKVENQDGRLVAHFKGTVHISGEGW